MIYKQFAPHSYLSNYIDAFWEVIGGGEQLQKEHILPDGCVDLIFNTGENCETDKRSFRMESGKWYLVGTMTTFKEAFLNSTNKLIGVRFKPAAFSSFYNHFSLHEIANQTIEFPKSISPANHRTEQQPYLYLNEYFMKRLTNQKHNLTAIIEDLQIAQGKMSIGTLAKRNYTTVRQLERYFRKYIRISPKEFANVTRFKFAYSEIKHNREGKSLLDIAFDSGYYDHAHLANEIKRYTGLTPSEL